MSILNIFIEVKERRNLLVFTNGKLYLLDLIEKINDIIKEEMKKETELLSNLRDNIVWMNPKKLDAKGWKLIYDYCTVYFNNGSCASNKIKSLYNKFFNNYKNYNNFKKFNYITKRMYNSKIRCSKFKNELLNKINNKYKDWNII